MNTVLEVSIPVLNEEDRLEKGVRELYSALRDYFKLPLICIADNGSSDKTPQLAEALAKELSGVRALRTSKPGVGLALNQAWSSSQADWVGYVDVDHSTDLRHLKDVADVIAGKKFQVCTGSRLLEDSVVEGRSLKREISSRSFNFILSELLDVQFSDGMCGFKFLSREHFKEIQNLGSLSEGWFFNTEILVKSEWLGKRVSEIPVHWKDDSDSRVKIAKLSLEYLQQMLRLRKEKPRYACSI